MAITNHLAVSRWAAQASGPSERRSMEGTTIWARGDTIYSYGPHFPMATIMRDREGATTFILVNGDTWGPTTSGHQSHVRGAIGGWDSLLVPFSALEAAGIDHATIQPHEIQDDTWAVNYERMSAAKIAELGNGWQVRSLGEGEYEARDQSSPFGNRWVKVEREGDTYLLPRWRHWLGEAVFSATVNDRVERKATRREREAFIAAAGWREREKKLRDDYLDIARYDVESATALARANLESWQETPKPSFPMGVRDGRRHERMRTRKGVTFLSAFDHNESRQLYFLAELPEPAHTVEQAFDVLAPPVVKRALAEDIEVQRQGDVFAVPCELPSEITHAAPFKRERLLGTDHTATEVLRPATGETYARGVMRHEPPFRDPDHSWVKLVGWHLIVRNTVPTT